MRNAKYWFPQPWFVEAHAVRSLFAAPLLLLLLLSGCSTFNAPSNPDQTPDQNTVQEVGAPTTSIRVQLNSAHSPQFAGFYLAMQKGYYAQEGLSVELIGEPSRSEASGEWIESAGQAVIDGDADFGIGGADMILRARAPADGTHSADLRAIASIYQINPLGILSLPGEGIRRPSDLAGKKIGVYSSAMNTSPDIQLLSLLYRMKIDPAGLEFVPLENLNSFADLTRKRVQAASGFSVIQQSIQANLSGILHNQILYQDYGVPIYPNIIFTTGEMIEQNPDIVQGFVSATLRGYQDAVENPEQAAQSVQTFVLHPSSDAEPAAAAGQSAGENLQIYTSIALAQIPFIDPGYTPLGWMDPAVWEATQKLLLEQNLLSAQIDFEQAFTNQFVEAASAAAPSTSAAAQPAVIAASAAPLSEAAP